jgi:hypothetical protein
MEPVVKVKSSFTTPGYEWASASRGYDWESRKALYGTDNPTMGEAYSRTMNQRETALEKTHARVNREREQALKEHEAKVRQTGTRTMIADGYWAGTEA